MNEVGVIDARFGYANVWVQSGVNDRGVYSTNVYCTGWDSFGNPITECRPFKPYLYYEAPNRISDMASAVSIFGKPLIRKSFITQRQRSDWCQNNQTTPTYENLPIIRQFLLNRFHGHERDHDFVSKKCDVWTIDIEIAVNERNQFPEPLDADFPINLITMHSSVDGIYHIWYMPPTDEDITIPYVEKGVNDDEPIDVSKRDYRRFKSETRLLADFMDFWNKNVKGSNTIITGWNISAFDMPYIYNRSCKVLGALFDVNNCMSPSGNVFFIDDENLMTKILRISGVAILDGLYLFKYKFEKGRQSYALDNVLDDELGSSKLDHSEYKTFYDFYTKNFSKYVEYNIMDVQRVIELDKKKKFIDLTRKLCTLGLVEYEAIYHTQPYVQGALIAQAKYDGKVFLSTTGRPDPEGGFRGAYVHDTKTGYYHKGGYTFDLNSLYPNVMNTINCSPETKAGVFRYDPNDENTVIFTPYSKDKDIRITKQKFEELLDTKFCCSANNVLYLKPEIQKGIMPKFLEYLYAERRATKNKGLECNVKINELRVKGITSGEEVEKLSTLSTLYDNTQQAYKIMLNSVYGLIGLRHYCCFDKDNAEAVTQTGQAIIKQSLVFVEQIHREMFNYHGEHPTVAGDTDSTMNNGEPIYNLLFGDKKIEWTKEEVAQFKEVANKVCDELNKRILDFVHSQFHTSVSRIEFKLETVFSHAAFVKPKHYCYRMVDKEGSYMVGAKKEWKITGLDLRRNLLPKPIQKALQYAVFHGILEEWSNSKFQDYMTQQYDEFLKMPIENKSFQFTYRTPCDAIGFLQMAPRATAVAKAATFYNQIVEKLQIPNCKPAKPGDSIHYVYIKNDNQFGIDIIGYGDNWPPEFDKMFEVDVKTMFEKMYWSKLEGIMKIIGWHHFDVTCPDEVDIFAL